MLLNISAFIGKFHPLLVHLPIGFLVLAVLLHFVAKHPAYVNVKAAVPVCLLMGTVAALLSCITGYLLSADGGYNTTTLDVHMWMGISVTIIAFVAWLISIQKVPIPVLNSKKALNVSIITIAAGIILAGHWGGTLTHGEGYLSFNHSSSPKEKKQIADIGEARLFEDIVQPILLHKCADCHNNSKMKGELSLQNLTQIQKGGKHGAVIAFGNVAESELIARVLLDPKDKKFMPTDGKPPLTTDEIALVSWWVEQASETDKTIAALSPDGEMMARITAYFGGDIHHHSLTGGTGNQKYATVPLAPALTDHAIADLVSVGFVVKQIHYNPDLLDITLPATMRLVDKMQLLDAVKENILWLNISDNEVTDEMLANIGTYNNLQRLRLDKNEITDTGIRHLISLPHLQSINLCQTKISEEALDLLSSIALLKTAYVWNTNLPQRDTILKADSSLQVIAGNNKF